jgi:hypothetical protein
MQEELMRDNEGTAELFQAFRKRAVTGLAATIGLTMVVTMAAAPSSAQTPSATPSLEQT